MMFIKKTQDLAAASAAAGHLCACGMKCHNLLVLVSPMASSQAGISTFRASRSSTGTSPPTAEYARPRLIQSAKAVLGFRDQQVSQY